MNITIELTNEQTKFIINNLYPMYLHDLSEIWGFKPNAYGIFEEDETRTLAEQNKVFDIWWSKPGVLYPYLARVEGIPAGFALVATPPYTPHGSAFYMNEFFILRPYRGKGIAEHVATQVMNQHRGTWEVQTNALEINVRAQQFWKKTLERYTLGKYQQDTLEADKDGTKLKFTLNNQIVELG
ncbi:GNAT family N-acetyltransferase [Paenibacillus xylanexedens]|uniref:GNAT family N-acetyltransferase n=1 Tax=Paenibacillus xylanexedens TaxID=528191 RepID=UPI0011AA895A|nr:GNAT family N-acetyltransferase [Paenibacillus xylanexedens]